MNGMWNTPDHGRLLEVEANGWTQARDSAGVFTAALSTTEDTHEHQELKEDNKLYSFWAWLYFIFLTSSG